MSSPRRYPLLQVDAFAAAPLQGNPCAVLLDTDDLDDAALLAIAREMNLSETAFVRRSARADFGVRYFTPAEEIPLAGHPTIATVFALIASGRLHLEAERTEITLEMPAGVIPVEIFSSPPEVQRIVMRQNRPHFGAALDPQEVLPLFGLTAGDALPGALPQVVSTGTPQLMVPLRSLDALRRARLDADAYAAFRQRERFFSPHLFCLQGLTPQGRTFARHFGLPPDTPEDPVTGSATGGMAAYLWHHGLIETPVFIAEQGHWMGRPGQVFVEVVGPPEAIETVKIGGRAALVLRGTLTL
ncbi:MAG TPA: PhzF family phenazine biosynthesis protein [Chloroflexi bacterium]|nr:PhzF family phenazine biosynthesis protein [Chloroflexota bacterium]